MILLIRNLFKRHKSIWSKQALAMFGSLFIIVEILNTSNIIKEDYNFSIILILFLICVIYGLVYTIRRVISYEFELQSGTIIRVEFGNIFEAATDYVLIPVNNYFDSDLGNDAKALVNYKSIFGQYINLSGQNETIKQIVFDKLKNKPCLDENLERNKKGLPDKKYDYGTTIVLDKTSKVDFSGVLVSSSFTKILEESTESDSTLPIITKAITSALNEIPQDKSIVLPLIGSGFGRIDLNINQLLQIILGCVIERCQRQNSTGAVKIVLPVKYKGELPLYYLKKEWGAKS